MKETSLELSEEDYLKIDSWDTNKNSDEDLSAENLIAFLSGAKSLSN